MLCYSVQTSFRTEDAAVVGSKNRGSSDQGRTPIRSAVSVTFLTASPVTFSFSIRTSCLEASRT